MHDWQPNLFRFIDAKHNLYECAVCRVSGTYTGLEYDRFLVIRDERLSARETKRGRQ
jgi:hypothetical protein